MDSWHQNEHAKKVKISILQMLFGPELHACECEELKHRENVCCNDFLHEIVLIIKVPSEYMVQKKQKREKGVTLCWFDWKPSSAQLNNLEQCLSFTRISEERHIDDIDSYFCYLVDLDELPCGKEAVVINQQVQRFFLYLWILFNQVSNAQHGRALYPRQLQLWSYQCQGNVLRLFSSTFFSEIYEKYHFCCFYIKLQALMTLL